MEKIYRCEECRREFSVAKECREHEKTCQPISLEERVQALERRLQEAEFHITLLKASDGYRRRVTVPEPICPSNPFIDPWGPTCKEGEGPWGPLNKVHHNVCEDCVNRDKKPGCIDAVWDAGSGAHCRNHRESKDI